MARHAQITSLALLVIAVLVATGIAWAEAPSGNDLRWHVLAGAGRDSASPAHSINGTLGQFAIGPAAAPGSAHAIGSGYWYGSQATPTTYGVYIPLLLRGAGP